MTSPNVHIYNSAISACARCNLWEKGYELFREMDEVCVLRDVVTYNAVLDAVSSQIQLGRKLFQEGELVYNVDDLLSLFSGRVAHCDGFLSYRCRERFLR
jgi:pentatricopeptide repeat protein